MPQLTLNQLEAFVALVEFDKNILDLEADKVRIENEQKVIVTQLQRLDYSHQVYQEELSKVQKYVNSLDLETKTLDAQLNQKLEKLDRTSAPKEYFILQDEIEHLKKLRIDLDNKLLEAWSKLEKAQEEFEQHKVQHLEKKNQLLKDQEHLSHRLDFTQKKIEQLTSERPSFEQKVDPETLQQYNDLKLRVKRPVVKAVANACSACSFTLSLADITKLNTNQLASCKECFRLLYLPEIISSARNREQSNDQDEQR